MIKRNFTDTDMSDITGPCSAEVVTDDSHVTKVIKIVPVNNDTDIFCRNMDMIGSIGQCSSAVSTDSLCVTQPTQVIKMVPSTITDDCSGKTEHDSLDWFAEVKQEFLLDIKQEPEDVCFTVLV